MTFKPWIGTFFGLLFSGAMERKTGLRKWRILSRIVAAQFRGFGRTTLAYDFFRFVSWPQLSSFEGMGKNRRIELRKNCRTSLCGNNPHVPHVRAHVQPIRAEKRQPRAGIVAQTCAAHVHRLAREKMHVQETCAARNKRNRKQKGTPDSKPVGRWQNDLRRILDTPGAGGIAPGSSWGLSVRSRTALHSGAKARPTPPSTARGSTPKPQKIPPVRT